MITFYELLDSVPEDVCQEQVVKDLKKVYDNISSMMTAAVKEGTTRTGYITPFKDEGGDQVLGYFCVQDQSKPIENNYNWHGQFLCQVVFNGGILISRSMIKKYSEKLEWFKEEYPTLSLDKMYFEYNLVSIHT